MASCARSNADNIWVGGFLFFFQIFIRSVDGESENERESRREVKREFVENGVVELLQETIQIYELSPTDKELRCSLLKTVRCAIASLSTKSL